MLDSPCLTIFKTYFGVVVIESQSRWFINFLFLNFNSTTKNIGMLNCHFVGVIVVLIFDTLDKIFLTRILRTECYIVGLCKANSERVQKPL